MIRIKIKGKSLKFKGDFIIKLKKLIGLTNDNNTPLLTDDNKVLLPD